MDIFGINVYISSVYVNYTNISLIVVPQHAVISPITILLFKSIVVPTL